jgi:hypothetical protein
MTIQNNKNKSKNYVHGYLNNLPHQQLEVILTPQELSVQFHSYILSFFSEAWKELGFSREELNAKY